MRVMGLDVGERSIGVALSDPFGWTAQGLTTVWRSGLERDLAALGKIIGEYQVERILVGLPLNMNGSKGPSALAAEELGRAAGEAFGLEVLFWDERLSTKAVERLLISGDVSRKKRGKVVDKLAAAYILQGYLDSLKNALEPV
ncbi:MAG: Holliday junction resolvase RuvX [Clostridiales bacterium]|nr:Holliday junction resolvase RuvX [Clostridiales bacterium]